MVVRIPILFMDCSFVHFMSDLKIFVWYNAFYVAFIFLFELNWVLYIFWISRMMFIDFLQHWLLLCWVCFHFSISCLFVCIVSLHLSRSLSLSLFVLSVLSLLCFTVRLCFCPRVQKAKCGWFWWVTIFPYSIAFLCHSLGLFSA